MKRKFIEYMTYILLAVFLTAPAAGAADVVSDDAQTQRRSMVRDAHTREWGFRHKDGIVLVLSGGGTKGLSHIGVFEVLEREKIPVAAVVGTSMGAIMGGLYAAGYTSAEMKDILSHADLMEIISGRSRSPVSDPGVNMPTPSGNTLFSLYMDKDKNVRTKRGLLSAKDLYAFLSELTSRVAVTDFDELPIPFAALATDLETGELVKMRNGNLASALRASMSIPGVFDPLEMDGRLLVDGGLKANLPVKVAKEMFPGHPVVAVNLSPRDIMRKREKMRSLLDIAAQTLEILMVEQVRENAAEADLIIAPDVSDFSTLDSGGYDKIIERGVEAAEPHIEEMRKLAGANIAQYAQVHSEHVQRRVPIVNDIIFTGVPKSIASDIHARYSEWIDKPLDMKKVADTVQKLSARKEFLSVEGRTEHVNRNSVNVIFSIERPPKYEFGLDGYIGNIHPDGWLSISAQIRDILMDGDVGSLEYRLGNNWGAQGTYFTAPDRNDSQFGLLLSARRESYRLRGAESDTEFDRHSARLAWYRSFDDKARLGIGYAIEKVTADDTYTGPYFSLFFSSLDDPILPTKGVAVSSNIWVPLDNPVVTHTAFQTHLPMGWRNWKLTFSGGLKTGDADNPPYAAVLGNREELYSLAKNQLIGDQAYWLHFGASHTLMKSWWGGINAEVFGNYGQVMREWKNSGSWWEAGLALSIPLNNFGGKFVVVYDQGGEVTFGYSIGIPHWWNGPLP